MKKLESIAIIPDGNRRYAKKSGISLTDAYLKGFHKVEEAVEWASEADVKRVTFWALSLDNYRKRSKAELSVVFRIMRGYLDKVVARANKHDIRLVFFGRKDLLPESIRKRIASVEEETRGNGHELDLAIAYGGHDELVNAAARLAEEYKAGKITRVDEKAFQEHLYCPQPTDLVIRTGGVQRLSGFMPWQNAYAEIYFSDKLWPEFSKRDFQKALDFYASTERRFGK